LNLIFQGFVGRRTSFEVKVNGKVIHSKLSTMAFPDFKEVAMIVEVIYNASVFLGLNQVYYG
jgi:selT/selW/selH-like putative selenoprotein